MGQKATQATSGPGGPARTGHAHAHALAFLIIVVISTSFPLGEHITHGLDPAVMMCLRFVLAALLMAPIVAWREGLKLPSARSFVRYLALGAPLAFFFWCMFEALRTTSGLNTSAIFTIVPGLAALFGAVLVGERLGLHRLAALFLGMIGALWVIFRGDPGRLVNLEVNIGDGIFLAGCLGYAVYSSLIKFLHRGEPILVQSFWTMVAAALWLLAASNVKLWRTDWSGVEVVVLGGIVYLAVLPTLITFFLTQYTTLRLGPTRVQAYGYALPAIVLLLDLALGKPAPPLMTVPGLAIVLAASLVVQRGTIREFR
ncbi:MAG: DMT family transporter [Rhodospirillales bacterium]|nr:DMT family transporter [Rhodospirillales bacterium]